MRASKSKVVVSAANTHTLHLRRRGRLLAVSPAALEHVPGVGLALALRRPHAALRPLAGKRGGDGLVGGRAAVGEAGGKAGEDTCGAGRSGGGVAREEAIHYVVGLRRQAGAVVVAAVVAAVVGSSWVGLSFRVGLRGERGAARKKSSAFYQA